MMWLVFPLLKLCHEFGHAFAVKARGGEVHEMGVMILVLTPVPYVDASSAWAFRSKWQRFAVGGAGMMVELFIASIALVPVARGRAGDVPRAALQHHAHRRRLHGAVQRQPAAAVRRLLHADGLAGDPQSPHPQHPVHRLSLREVPVQAPRGRAADLDAGRAGVVRRVRGELVLLPHPGDHRDPGLPRRAVAAARGDLRGVHRVRMVDRAGGQDRELSLQQPEAPARPRPGDDRERAGHARRAGADLRRADPAADRRPGRRMAPRGGLRTRRRRRLRGPGRGDARHLGEAGRPAGRNDRPRAADRGESARGAGAGARGASPRADRRRSRQGRDHGGGAQVRARRTWSAPASGRTSSRSRPGPRASSCCRARPTCPGGTSRRASCSPMS